MKALLICALILACVTPALADDEADPKVYDLWFDGHLAQNPNNPKTDALVEADTLAVHVDPTRLFPAPATKAPDLGFDASEAPPDVVGFYVVGTGSGKNTELLMQPGECTRTIFDPELEKAEDNADAAEGKVATAKKQLEDAKQKLQGATAQDTAAVTAVQAEVNAAETAKATADTELASARAELQKVQKETLVAESPKALVCTNAPDWKLADGRDKPYICGNQPLSKLLEETAWSLVQRRKGDTTQQDECLAKWTFGLDKRVTSVTAEVFNGGAPPDKLTLAMDGGRFATSIPIKANTRAIALTVTFEGGGTTSRTIPVKARPRDTHTRLRLQAELLATNRLRAISFAVAVTPVRRAFLTDGPGGCFFGCAVTASAVLRIAGDDKTVVQFGGAVGINLLRAFQINGGLLFGTNDTNSAWRIERNWFVGIAIDPIILSEAITTGAERN